MCICGRRHTNGTLTLVALLADVAANAVVELLAFWLTLVSIWGCYHYFTNYTFRKTLDWLN